MISGSGLPKSNFDYSLHYHNSEYKGLLYFIVVFLIMFWVMYQKAMVLPRNSDRQGNLRAQQNAAAYTINHIIIMSPANSS
jgi:hypothetical protein